MSDSPRGPDDLPFMPDRHPDGGNFPEEALTAEQINAYANTKPSVWSRAVRLYQMICDGQTAELPADEDVRDALITIVVDRLVVDAQESAVTASDRPDRAALASAHDAASDLTAAEDRVTESKKILDNPYEAPGGGFAPAREIIVDHQKRLVLAAEREREGDTRHLDTAYPRLVTILVGVVLFGLDLGVWGKWLGLGPLDSTSMLFKWIVALVVSTLVSLAVTWAVERFQRKDRVSADQRSSVADYNRETDRRVRQGLAVGHAPDLNELRDADRQRARAQQVLIAVAAAGGTLLAIRIALIARDSGQPFAIAAVIGVVIGLLLSLVIVGLGYRLCRGNTLGDQIAEGAAAVEQIDDDLDEILEQVVAARTSAQKNIAAADQFATQAEVIRAGVIGDASESLLLFGAWARAPRQLLERPQIDPRQLHTADKAAQILNNLQPRIDKIHQWLEERPTGVSLALADGLTRRALPSGQGARPRSRVVALPPRGQLGGPVPYRITLPRRPVAPLAWAAAAVAVITAAGVIAAASTAGPEGAQNTEPVTGITRVLG